MIECTENAITNALEEKVDTMVSTRNIKDIDEDVTKLKQDLLDEGAINYVRCKKLRKRINDVENDVVRLCDCEKSNAYDIANIIDKIDELESAMEELTKYVKEYVKESSKIIKDLDHDVRQQLL